MFTVEYSGKKAVITPAQPFRLLPTVLAHGWTDCYPFYFDINSNTLFVAGSTDNATFVVKATEKLLSSNLAALVVKSEPHEFIKEGVKLVARTLNLDWDLAEFYKLCKKDKLLSQIPALGAGRIVRGSTLFEDATKAISFTNMRWTQASKVINRYTSAIGNAVFVKEIGKNLYLFPTAQQIAQSGIEVLKDAGLGYRAKYVYELALNTTAEKLNFAKATTMPDDELFKFLTSIKGIGKTTAHYLMIMYGRFSKLSVDSAVVAHVKSKHPQIKAEPQSIQEYYQQRFNRFAALGWFAEVMLERLKKVAPP